MSDQYTSPLLFERYEYKFHIPMEMVEPISNFVEIYCELDPYSLREDDNFYKVNNLYFDSPGFLFLQKRLSGMDHRFNLRIRSYGDNPIFPYFCEVKHKTMGIVKKKRAKISDPDWAKKFSEKSFDGLKSGTVSTEEDYKHHFLRLAYVHNVEPKIFTQYRRKAYASIVDEYARVTFDKDLRFERRNTYDLCPSEKALSHYDNPLNFDEDKNVILELKCTTQVPVWFLDLIRTFNLSRMSFSKYVAGVQEVMNDNLPLKLDRVSNHLF
jgi:SPX domain protein involved in polyphosphate accumulation